MRLGGEAKFACSWGKKLRKKIRVSDLSSFEAVARKCGKLKLWKVVVAL
jgi:hypothetical protein